MIAAAAAQERLILSRCRDCHTLPIPTPTRPRRRHHPIRARQPIHPINIRPPLRPHASIPCIYARVAAVRQVPCTVVKWRAHRDHLAVLRQTHAHPAVIVGPLAEEDIRAAHRPRAARPVKHANLSTVDDSGEVVIGRPDSDGIAVGGQTDGGAETVAFGDFVGGVFGPGESVVAGEVDVWAVASTINNRALILSCTADGDGNPNPSNLRPLRP